MALGITSYVIIIIIIVVAIIAIAFILNSSFLRQHLGITTSRSTTTASSTNTSNPNNTTTVNMSNITAVSCLASGRTVALDNGNFSTGTYSGWTLQGNGFGTVPVNLIEANAKGNYYGAPWNGFLSDFAATTYQGGTERSTGNITSDTFKVTEPYLNFQVISPQSNYLYVEIYENGKPFLINHYNTFLQQGNVSSQSTFVNASIPLASLLCQNASIKVSSGIVNSRTSTYNYIAVTDFYLSRTQAVNATSPINSTVV